MLYKVLAVNFLLTAVAEGLLIFLIFRRKDYTYYSFLCNLLTNPALNVLLLFLVRLWSVEYYSIFVFMLEAAAVLTEAYVYKLLCGFGFLKGLSLSFLLNAASFLCGVLLCLI